MPWKVIQKLYDQDKRYEGLYHIQFYSTTLTFDVVCKHVFDSYKWLLYCDCPHIANVILGTPDKIKDVEACRRAVSVVRKNLVEKTTSTRRCPGNARITLR